MIAKWKLFWRAFGLARRVLRLRYKDEKWTEQDAQVLAEFLQSGTGLKLNLKMTQEIIAESQKTNAEGGSAFSQGLVHGKKELWVALGVLASAGVTPQDDTSDDYIY